MKDTRIFGGKRYHLHIIRSTKATATTTANSMRNRGLRARVVEGTDFSQTGKQGRKKKQFAVYTR